MSEAASPKPVNVLFVCVGNSCRSQMAEAWARRLGPDKVRAFSAGSAPFGRIVPETYVVMAEKGITLEGQTSKGLRAIPVAEMDVVVSMGCEVACPVPVGFKGRIIEWDIPDPFSGDLDFYREVRDLIESQVKDLLNSLEERPSASS